MRSPASSSRMIVDPVVATIGVFDGVHRGHRALLDRVRERARLLGARPLVISFDPHPIEVLAPTLPARRLATRAQKLRLFAESGLDVAWLLPFSPVLARLEAEEFVEFVLARIQLVELWIGVDFRFGRGRSGDRALLEQIGARRQISVQTFAPIEDAGRTISSTAIRDLLGAGEIERAADLLGHSYVLESTVGRGRGEGAKLLVATANLTPPPSQCLPGRGVYAGWAELESRLHPAAINIGRRPTLTDDLSDTVEVHLIGWSGDLRGRLLPVHFGCRLREERRFSGLDELRAAVERDLVQAQAWLDGHPPRPAGPAST